MIKEKILLDTSVLMNSIENIEFNMDIYDYVICSVVADELDKHKESHDKYKSFKARKALKVIEKHEDSFEFIISDIIHNIPENFDISHNDTKILGCALNKNYKISTLDRGMRIRANALGIGIIDIEEESIINAYKGYKEVYLDLNTDDADILSKFYENPHENIFNLLINEYVAIIDKSTDKVIDTSKWNGESYHKLKLPKIHGLKSKNVPQLFAMDLLNDTSIPIKIIAGNFGSGKTFLTTKMAVYHVKEKGNYSNIMVVRQPQGTGKEIGFLPGTKDEKTSDFFKPFTQHLEGGEFEAHQLEQRGVLTKEIPYYMKGLSIGDTFIMVDEAEDLDIKTIKMIGSRIEENSCVCFVGDYKQAEQEYILNNGLMYIMDKLKNEKLVGMIVLDEDVRSSASKLFADI